MKLRYLLLVMIILIGSVGLVGLRNYQMDSGLSALKADKGGIAINKLRPLASLGDSKAQYWLGSIYAFGWGGVKKSDEEAVYWFRRAAMFVTDESDPAAPAELEVGKTYAGIYEGAKIDKVESIKWLQLATAGGSKEAATLLAKTEQRK